MTTIKLVPVVRFREFPFGTKDDPSMRDAIEPKPWPDQEHVLSYLRSGRILALPMGADLFNQFNRENKANGVIHGSVVGGATPMTDGHWYWYAGLIHYVEKYNLRVPREFVEHVVKSGISIDVDDNCRYDFSYF